MKKVSERSTKKELLEAVDVLEAAMQNKASGSSSSAEKVPEKPGVAHPPALKPALSPALSDMLAKATGLGETVQAAVKALSGMAEQFAKEFASAREEFEREREARALERAREAEEYDYTTRKERREKRDAFERDMAEKKATFDEGIEEKTVALGEREKTIKETEQDLSQLRKQVENFPKELEKAVALAESRAAQAAREEAKIQSDLLRKDSEKEREVSALRIANLEAQSKRYETTITMLEKQLAAANQKAQELAVTVIEARKQPPPIQHALP